MKAEPSPKKSISPKRILAGGARRSSLPGQDPDLSASYELMLTNELNPKDGIERLWIADIAYITARLDYIRESVRGFHDAMIKKEIDSHSENLTELSIEYRNLDFEKEEINEIKKLLNTELPIKGVPCYLNNPLYLRFIGIIASKYLERIKLFDDLEQRWIRERDRIITQFERRRREQVVEAVRVIEGQSGKLPPLSNDV